MWRVSETADERRGQQSELGAGDPVLAVYYVGGSERRKGEREEERLPVSLAVGYHFSNATLPLPLEVDIGLWSCAVGT